MRCEWEVGRASVVDIAVCGSVHKELFRRAGSSEGNIGLRNKWLRGTRSEVGVRLLVGHNQRVVAIHNASTRQAKANVCRR